MAKQIIINYKDNEYTLEFNRKTVRRMEDAGFVPDTNKPETLVTELFKGAFMMHHRRIDPALVEEIWDAQKKKSELLGVLSSMYAEPIASLMEDDDSGEDENPTWKVL